MPHSIGYNVETGFFNFINGSRYITNDPDEADWHYLPIMWSYWQLNNDYGRINREQMQTYLDSIVLDYDKTFTISEADNEPGFNIKNMVVFSANSGDNWIPTPLVTLPHKVPAVLPEKKYLSNFVGTIKPWETRIKMVQVLQKRLDVKIIQSKKGESLFVNTILESYSTLCPRGSALSSYRFYETMQLGVVPIMISDEDFRPFKNKIDWDICSYYFDSVDKLPEFFKSVSIGELEQKSVEAKYVWERLFEKWPQYILDELNEINS